MKNNMLRYAMFVCLATLVSVSSCSDTPPSDDTPDPDKLKSIGITPSPVSINAGQTTQLTAAATPETASLKNLRWSSSDNKTATVDENGLVKAVEVGTATITALCDGVRAECEVTVTRALVALQKIDLTPSGISMRKGDTKDIVAKLVPENADYEGSLVWDSSNKSVATVDQNGHVVSLTEGVATITATIGSVVGTCPVEVYSDAATRPFTFLQLNLWEGLSKIENGQAALIKHLVALKPDAASFCEFRSTGEAASVLKAAADALLAQTGVPYYYTYRGGRGTRGVLSRHPIVSTDGVNGSDWFYRTIVNFYGQDIVLYASHAYHSYYACYLPRGYNDGNGSSENWNKLNDGPVVNVTYILEREELSGRTQIATDFIADSKIQKAAGRLCIFGGDLNQPSHLDWTEAAKNNYDHNGCVVAWPISTKVYADGIRDAFREIYPNPVTHPGITWPVYLEGKTTSWAPQADDRDRIDFVYFRPETNFEVTKAQMVGPSATVSHSKKEEDVFVDKAAELIQPVDGIWPSDHRGLFVTFSVKFAQ